MESALDFILDDDTLSDLATIAAYDSPEHERIRQVYDKLHEDLALSRGQIEAINRLRMIAKQGDMPGLMRNNLGKALNALGLETPAIF